MANELIRLKSVPEGAGRLLLDEVHPFAGLHGDLRFIAHFLLAGASRSDRARATRNISWLRPNNRGHRSDIRPELRLRLQLGRERIVDGVRNRLDGWLETSDEPRHLGVEAVGRGMRAELLQ